MEQRGQLTVDTMTEEPSDRRADGQTDSPIDRRKVDRQIHR